MKTDHVFVLLLVVLLPLSGCFDGGAIDTAEATDDIGDGWINEQGVENNWNISLTSNQWIEVQSATGIAPWGSENLTYTIPLMLEENAGWKFVNDLSPIFGGSYTLCRMSENACYVDSENDWGITQWSIIYRIHDV